jgi:hypothetical protein
LRATLRKALAILADEVTGVRESLIGLNGARNEAAVVAVCHSVQQAVTTSLEDHAGEVDFPFQLILGGESDLSSRDTGPLELLAIKRLGLLYVDANLTCVSRMKRARLEILSE